MHAPTAAGSDQKSMTAETVEGEISKSAREEDKGGATFESDVERIRHSVARLTSTSIEELQGLTSELQRMQDFLRAEVESVQRQIDSALAGIAIIVETIGPWKNIAAAAAPAGSARPGRANIEAAPTRRLAGAG